MSEKKADKSRYWITFLLKDLEVGDTFDPSLPHLTVIPWFVADMDEEEITKSFNATFSDLQTFNITLGSEREFKHRRKIPVNLIAPSAEILNLHTKALEWCSILNARWAVKDPHVDSDYIPHIRRRPGYNQTEGDKIELSSLSLVKAHRRGDDLRTLAAKVALK